MTKKLEAVELDIKHLKGALINNPTNRKILARLTEKEAELNALIGKHQMYTAYYLEGQWKSSIASVLANSPETAKTCLEEELKKPGRGRYLKLWQRDGKLVRVRE
jgi:hypothetical protein